MDGVRFLKKVFDKYKISYNIIEIGDNRGSIIAKLEGNGKKKPLILLNHIDVVPCDLEKWDFNPFSGKIIDGYIIGRGTIDMKGLAILQLVSLIYFKANNIIPDRDIYFAACCDEEAGGTKGAEKLAQSEKYLHEAEYLLNEMSFIEADDNGVPIICPVMTGEKYACSFELTVPGSPGHGSMPHSDNANIKAMKIIDRILSWKTDINISDSVQEYFKAVSVLMQDEKKRKAYEDIRTAVRDEDFKKELLSNKAYNSSVRDSIALTYIRSSTAKINVIPSECRVGFDCRLLPSTDKEWFLGRVKDLIGDDSVKMKMIFDENFSPDSDFDTPLFGSIERVLKTYKENMVVAPCFTTGGTDSRYFRRLGIQCYGFMPFYLRRGEFRGVHGHNEMISVENIKRGLEIYIKILEDFLLDN